MGLGTRLSCRSGNEATPHELATCTIFHESMSVVSLMFEISLLLWIM